MLQLQPSTMRTLCFAKGVRAYLPGLLSLRVATLHSRPPERDVGCGACCHGHGPKQRAGCHPCGTVPLQTGLQEVCTGNQLHRERAPRESLGHQAQGAPQLPDPEDGQSLLTPSLHKRHSCRAQQDRCATAKAESGVPGCSLKFSSAVGLNHANRGNLLVLCVAVCRIGEIAGREQMRGDTPPALSILPSMNAKLRCGPPSLAFFFPCLARAKGPQAPATRASVQHQ